MTKLPRRAAFLLMLAVRCTAGDASEFQRLEGIRVRHRNAPGDYRLHIRPAEKNAATGRYEITLIATRAPTDDERTLVLAVIYDENNVDAHHLRGRTLVAVGFERASASSSARTRVRNVSILEVVD